MADAFAAGRADSPVATHRKVTGIDAVLVLMVFIWAANYSVIKHVFAEVPPHPFNALRLTIASLIFLVVIASVRRRGRRPGRPLSRVFFTDEPLVARDRWDLIWLGLIGHFLYQYCFVRGVAETSVSNTALIIGATPVVIAVWSALLGRERITRVHWAGAAVSIFGIYLVVGRDASFANDTLRGDLIILVSVACWAAYTLGAARLIRRHSALFVTGVTMAIGTVPYVIVSLPEARRVNWQAVSGSAWTSLLLSAVLALCVAYVIWYAAVQKIGPARTAIYSNLIPISAMAIAAIWLHEPISAARIAGAIAVLLGVLLTRLGRS
jgi:drug/metabolite transporter (DMT)-like permease